MKRASLCALLLLFVSSCAPRSESSYAPYRVVQLENGRPHSPRSVGRLAPEHYPPAGRCRVWFLGRATREQPASTKCESLIGQMPRGSFLLYEGKAWDALYDWHGHARHHPGTVPAMVLRIMARQS